MHDNYTYMPGWVTKAIVQKGISFLPYSNKINYVFQRYVTKGIILTDELFLHKLDHARNHIDHYAKFGKTPVANAVALELGTGWYPIVPFALYLSGFNEIITIDQSGLLRDVHVHDVIAKFIHLANQGKLSVLLPLLQADRLSVFKNIADNKSSAPWGSIMEELNIHVMVGDAGATRLEAGKIDFFISNNTLEHIPEPVIVHIFKEFHRISSKNALMSHFIDLTDHFAHFDKSISVFNFLRFSESQWKIINNSVQYLNRLRIDTFMKIHDKTQFRIIEKEHLYADKKHLNNLPIDAQYKHLSEQDLLISHTWLVSVPVK